MKILKKILAPVACAAVVVNDGLYYISGVVCWWWFVGVGFSWWCYGVMVRMIHMVSIKAGIIVYLLVVSNMNHMAAISINIMMYLIPSVISY